MAEFPALPLFTDAFIADTTHLNATQTGAYLMLLMCAWRTKDCCIPNDDQILARYARMTTKEWNQNKKIILQFWIEKEGQLFQKRLKDERRYVESKINSSSAAGKASALKRKERGSTDVDLQYQRNPQRNFNENSTPTPTPTPTKEEKNITKKEPKIPDSDFEDFWKGWVPFDMDKGSKQNALKFYQLARKETTHETIIGKRDQYLASCHNRRSKTCHASSWLNPTARRGWDDDYSTPTTQPASYDRSDQDSKFRDRVNETARQIDCLLGE